MKSVDSSAAVQVSFNLPAEAAMLLSQLVHLGSPGLAQIGVTSVSIDDADAIPLKINNVRANSATEHRNKSVENIDERHSNCSTQPSPRILSSLRNNIMQLLGVATGKVETVPIARDPKSQPQNIENDSQIKMSETIDTSEQNANKLDVVKPISTLPVFVEEEELELDEKKYNRPWQSAELNEAENKVSDLKQLDVKTVRFSQDETVFPRQPPSNGCSVSPSVSSLPARSLSTELRTSPTIIARSSPRLTVEINSPNYSKETVRSDGRQIDNSRNIIETYTVPPPSYLTAEPDDLKLIRRRSVNLDIVEDARKLSHPMRPNRWCSSSPVDEMRIRRNSSSFKHPIRSDDLTVITMPRDRISNVEHVPQLPVPRVYSPIPVSRETTRPIFQPSLPDNYSSIVRDKISNMEPISRQAVPGNYSPITMSMDDILKASPRSHHLNRPNDSSSHSLSRDKVHKVPPISPNSIRPVDLMPMTRSADEMWKIPSESHQMYQPRGVSPRGVSPRGVSPRIVSPRIVSPSGVSIMKVSANNSWKIPPVSQQSSRSVSWSPPNTMAVDDGPHSLSRQQIEHAERQRIRHHDPNEMFEVPYSALSLCQPMEQAERQPIRHHDKNEIFEVPHSLLSLRQPMEQAERQPIRHHDQNEMFEVPHFPLSLRPPIGRAEQRDQAERHPIRNKNQNTMFDIPLSPLSPHLPKKKRRKREQDADTNAHRRDALSAAGDFSDHSSFLPAKKRYSPAEIGPLHPPLFPEQYPTRDMSLFARNSGLIVNDIDHRGEQNISNKSRELTPDEIIRTIPNEKLAPMNYEHGKREFISDERDQFRESLSYSRSNVRGMEKDFKYGGSNHGQASNAFSSSSKSPTLGASKARNIHEFKDMSLLNSTSFEPYISSAIAEPERMDIRKIFEPPEKHHKIHSIASDTFATDSYAINKKAPDQNRPLGGMFNGMFDDLRRLEKQSTSINSFNSVGFPSGPADAKSYLPHESYDVTQSLTPSGFYDKPRSLYDFPRPGASPFDLPRLGEPTLFDLRKPFYPETHDLKRPFDPTPYDLKKFIDPVPLPSYDTKKSVDPPTPYEFSLGNWVSSNHSPSLGGSGAAQSGGSQIYQPWQECGSNKIHVKLKPIDHEQLRPTTDDLNERNIRASSILDVPFSVDNRYLKAGAARVSPDCVQGAGVVPKKRLRLRVPSKDEPNLEDNFVDERDQKDHAKHEFVEKTRDKSEGELNRLGSIYANPQSMKDFPPGPAPSTDSSKMHLKKIRLVRWNNSSVEHTADERTSAPPSLSLDHFNSVRPVLWNRSDRKQDMMTSDDWLDDTRIIPSTLSAESSEVQVYAARDIVQPDVDDLLQSNVRRCDDDDDDYTGPRKSSDVSSVACSRAPVPHQPEMIKLMLKEDVDNEASGGIVSKKHRAIRYFLARRSSSVEETPDTKCTEDTSGITSSSHSPGNEGVVKVNDSDGPTVALQDTALTYSSDNRGSGDSMSDVAANNVQESGQLGGLDGPDNNSSYQNEEPKLLSVNKTSSQLVVEANLSSSYTGEDLADKDATLPLEESRDSTHPVEERRCPILPVEESNIPAQPLEESRRPTLPLEEGRESLLPIVESRGPELPVTESSGPELPVDDEEQSSRHSSVQ